MDLGEDVIIQAFDNSASDDLLVHIRQLTIDGMRGLPAIVRVKIDNDGTAATTCGTIKSEFVSCFDMMVPTELEFDEQPEVFKQRHMVLKSGKIGELWDDYHGIWNIWKPKPVAQNTGIIFNKLFRRRFQGFNHGRHFDRKRRD